MNDELFRPDRHRFGAQWAPAERKDGSRVETAGGLQELTATEAVQRLAAGEISSLELVEDCLRRIEERDGDVGAWAYLDPQLACDVARLRDEERASGRGVGPLHGVPVGLKDVIDTADMPTELGSPVFEGRRPTSDAAIATALRDAGAIILGKTVTTELAVFHPGKTRNPVNLGHTPGGSSSGSAAAVADFQVPLAIGTQTAGSVVRPASYCGVFGFKPTFGAISRRGVLIQSPPLDTIGTFARSIEDLALITECLTAFDEQDGDMYPRSRASLSQIASSASPGSPALAFVKSTKWRQADPDMAKAIEQVSNALGDTCTPVELPEAFDKAWDYQRLTQFADIAKSYGPLLEKYPGQFSEDLCAKAETGARVSAVDYNRARDLRDVLNAALAQVLQRYDAIITPAATGVAPKGLLHTGDPVFCSLWTYLGVPAISLPLLEIDGMPVGVQLVGRTGDDGRLLRTARWIVEQVGTGVSA